MLTVLFSTVLHYDADTLKKINSEIKNARNFSSFGLHFTLRLDLLLKRSSGMLKLIFSTLDVCILRTNYLFLYFGCYFADPTVNDKISGQFKKKL